MSDGKGPGEVVGEISKRVGLNIGIGFLAAIPFIGSAAASVINGELSTRWQKRYTGMMQDVSRRLEAQKEEHIDLAFLQSDAFVDILSDAASAYVRSATDEHRQNYASFMVGVALDGQAAAVKARRLLRLLDELQPVEIAALKALIGARNENWQDSSAARVAAVLAERGLPEDDGPLILGHLVSLGLYQSKHEELALPETFGGSSTGRRPTVLGYDLLDYVDPEGRASRAADKQIDSPSD